MREHEKRIREGDERRPGASSSPRSARHQVDRGNGQRVLEGMRTRMPLVVPTTSLGTDPKTWSGRGERDDASSSNQVGLMLLHHDGEPLVTAGEQQAVVPSVADLLESGTTIHAVCVR